MNPQLLRRLFLPLLFLLLLAGGPAGAAIALRDDVPDPLRNWSFEYGYAYITHDVVSDVLLGHTSTADGPSGGHVQLLTAAYRLAEPDWQIGDHLFKPLLELPFTLGIVDENGRSPFLNYSTSFEVRWRDFPWNDFISTTAAMGLGLAYSDKIFLMDHQTHPEWHRSHVKFNWPIELTLALPQFPQHQLTVFIMHQSGGHIFDRGGINNVGFGYRFGL
ncbi:MAG: hypothetical protein WCK77_10295 [Verrucomicrobiota bacterium]